MGQSWASLSHKKEQLVGDQQQGPQSPSAGSSDPQSPSTSSAGPQSPKAPLLTQQAPSDFSKLKITSSTLLPENV